jgi:hypothetical protein
MMRKARKIRERLGASNNLFEPVWDKPKGLHWNTFERMRQKERIANNQSWVVTRELLDLKSGLKTIPICAKGRQ